jgi:hypothetical protein
MMDALWHAVFLAANLWGAGNAAGVVDVPDGGTVQMGGFPAFRVEARTEYRVEVRTESGPPVLSQLPYLGRLFRNVGWSQYVVPVLPPIKAGARCESEAPSDNEILSALPELTRIEGVYEEWRDDVQMVFEKLVDQVDPPRYFPLIGQAQLHRVHWKCTVSFTEAIKLSYPVSFEVKRERSEVVYIDKDRLHLCAVEQDDSEPQEITTPMPDTRVVACWENRAGSMVGSVYLFSEETKRTIEAAGRLEVQAFDMAPALKGEEPRLLAQWTFDAAALEKLQRKDQIGIGYTLTAPWADLPANVENIKLHTVYVPAQGASRSDEPTYVARRSVDNDGISASQTEERRTKVVQAQAVSNQRQKESPPATRTTALSVAEIVALSKAGVSKGIILRQMETAKVLSVVHAIIKADEFPTLLSQMKWLGLTVLTVDDLIEMTKQGVDEEIIRTMQDQLIAYLKQYCQ